MAGKKKKGKKEKKPKDTEDKLAAVDKQFFEITITDLNNKLSRLRTHTAKLEETNEELTEKLEKLEEDKTDVTVYLTRRLAEEVDTVKELDAKLQALVNVRDQENKDAANKIKELELKYKAMHEQLTSEIKLLNGKLNSLEEFRVQKDELLAKFDEQEADLKEQQRNHKELLYDMERKIVLDKNQLKRDVEHKLLKLSDDFTKSSEVRIAAYTQRLIRENFALNNEMDRMIITQRQMEQETKAMQNKTNELNDLFLSNETARLRLVKTCQNQVDVIEKLTTQYEGLKERHQNIRHYKKQYENFLKKNICEKFTVNDMCNKISIMAQRVEMVKSDKAKLIGIHSQHEAEIIRLRNVLRNIKFAIQIAIIGEQDETEDEPFKEAQRKSLLYELMLIVTSYTEDPNIRPSASAVAAASAAVYRPGAVGLMPRSKANLLELFKREAKKIALTELISPEFKHRIADGRITPQPRAVDGPNVFDVDSSSVFFLSSSHDNVDDFQDDDEDEEGEIGGAGVSSADTSAATPVPLAPVQTPGRPPMMSVQKSGSTDLSKSESVGREDGRDTEDEDDVKFFY